MDSGVTPSEQYKLEEALHCTPSAQRPSSALPYQEVSTLGHHDFYSSLGTAHMPDGHLFEMQKELKKKHSVFKKKAGTVAG